MSQPVFVDPPHHFPAGPVVHVGEGACVEAADWNGTWWQDLMSDSWRDRAQETLLARIASAGAPAGFRAAHALALDILAAVALTEVDVDAMLGALRSSAPAGPAEDALLDLARVVVATGRGLGVGHLSLAAARWASGPSEGAAASASALVASMSDRAALREPGQVAFAVPPGTGSEWLDAAASPLGTLYEVPEIEMHSAVRDAVQPQLPERRCFHLLASPVARVGLWGVPSDEVCRRSARLLRLRGVRHARVSFGGRADRAALKAWLRAAGRAGLTCAARVDTAEDVAAVGRAEALALVEWTLAGGAAGVEAMAAACRKRHLVLWVDWPLSSDPAENESVLDQLVATADDVAGVRTREPGGAAGIDALRAAKAVAIELQVELRGQASHAALGSPELALTWGRRRHAPAGPCARPPRRTLEPLGADDAVCLAGELVESPLSLCQCTDLASDWWLSPGQDADQGAPAEIALSRRFLIFSARNREVVEMPYDSAIAPILTRLRQPQRVRELGLGGVWLARLTSMGIVSRV